MLYLICIIEFIKENDTSDNWIVNIKRILNFLNISKKKNDKLLYVLKALYTSHDINLLALIYI